MVMAFGDYSRLFGISDEQMRRRRMPFGSAGAPDMFAGSAQHQQALAEQASEPGLAESLIGAAGTVGGAYMNRPQLGAKLEDAMHKPADSVATEAGPLGTVADLNLQKPEAIPIFGGGGAGGTWADPHKKLPWGMMGKMPFGGYRAYGGPMYPGRRYRVGDEEVVMLPGGGAQVIPATDPTDTLKAEQLPLGTQADITPRTAALLGGLTGPTTPAFNPNDDPTRPPWNRQAPTGLPTPTTVIGTPDPAMEPSPYDGKTRNQLGDDATPRERALGEIQDLQRAGPQRTSSMWRRVGQGVLGGLSEWAAAGAPGGIGGALGAIGAGASIYGASKGAAAEMEHRRKLAGLFGKYKEAVAPELAEAERQTAMMKTQGVGLENQSKRLEILHKTYGPLMKQMEAAGRTPKEIADYLTRQGIPMTEQDVRERKIVYDAKGQAVEYTTKGPVEAAPVDSLPINYDERRSPVTVTPEGGQPITGVVSDAKKLDTLVGVQQTGARMQQTKENQARMQANADRAFQLQREKFDLDVQKEARMLETARARAGAAGAKTVQKQADDLAKARQAVEALRIEADKLGNISRTPADPDYNEEAETTRAKALEDIAKRERKALSVYEAILNRIQNQ